MARPRSQTPTPAELEVLEFLWKTGPCTVRQVLDELNRKRPRAYTSVMSLLNVMTDKGLLRRKPHGRAFIYEARAKEQPTRGELVGDLVRRAFGGSVRQLMASALEQTDPSPEELEEIRRLIEAYKSREEDKS
jgi:predicted transcriptional regulator